MFPEVFRLRKPDVDTEEGYQQTVQLLKEWEAGMEAQRRHYEARGLTAEDLRRVMEPIGKMRVRLWTLGVQLQLPRSKA